MGSPDETAATPTMMRNPVTLMTTPNQSIVDVVTSPTTSRTVPTRNAATDVIARRRRGGHGLPGREPRVVSVEGALDLVEPALFVLGERHV